MEATSGHLGRWWILHVSLLIVLTQVQSRFIDFRPGYEYIYRLNATADVISVGKFLLRAKISYTNIQELLDSQELLLRVYGFQFSPIGQPDVRGHDFDFSSWFSFVIMKHGVILRVYHDEDDLDEVIAIKKGIAGLLSAKLHSEDEVPVSTKGGHYSYTTEEVGHEGPHTADYLVFPTADGKAFKKTRTSIEHRVENVKSNFEKTLHFHDELGTIHKVLVQEDFTGPTKSKPGFDPYFAMRKVEPAQKFGNVEYPEMKAISDAELHFLTREKALFDITKPTESIKSGSVHVSNHIPRRVLVEKNIDVAWDAIRGNLTCMKNQPAKGSPELSTCFFDIVNVLKRLPAEHVETIAEFYFTNLSSVYVIYSNVLIALVPIILIILIVQLGPATGHWLQHHTWNPRILNLIPNQSSLDRLLFVSLGKGNIASISKDSKANNNLKVSLKLMN